MDQAGKVLHLVALAGEALSESDIQHEHIRIILRCKRWDNLSIKSNRATFEMIRIGRHVFDAHSGDEDCALESTNIPC